MIGFPHCKINLGLDVLSKRDDGYHDISSVMFPVRLFDILEINEGEKTRLSVTGKHIEGNNRDNLVIRAWEMLSEDFDIPPVEIHLHKVIPTGAGLGGGSSDGAFSLKMLNEMFELGLPEEKLHYYSSRMGSDCPFFLQKQASHVTGRGTDLAPFDIDLSPYWLLLYSPALHSSTAEAYRLIEPSSPSMPIIDILRKPIEEWKDLLKNDFEEPVFKKFEELSRLKENLYNRGAVYAGMSGSGSSVYGIFREKPEIDDSEEAFVIQMEIPE